MLLDTVNHARIWWWPPFRQHVEIHTILDLADTPDGKVQRCHPQNPGQCVACRHSRCLHVASK